jgi:hypothetical protein
LRMTRVQREGVIALGTMLDRFSRKRFSAIGRNKTVFFTARIREGGRNESQGFYLGIESIKVTRVVKS